MSKNTALRTTLRTIGGGDLAFSVFPQVFPPFFIRLHPKDESITCNVKRVTL